MAKTSIKQIETEGANELRGQPTPEKESTGTKFWATTLSALGVVYGDIGTSPLYTLQKCLLPSEGITPSAANIFGLLSLIFWSLVILVSIKYIVYVMRATNENEGGILALMALIEPAHPKDQSRRKWLIFLGISGAALLYGDGIITPAISVLSAVEGLEVASTSFSPYTLPIAVAIIILLFLFQRVGTSKVGWSFGPFMILWFLTLTATGISGISQHPSILRALDPVYAFNFFYSSGFNAFLVLGSVFLAVTGAEALYADVGHFGKRPIRAAWFLLVLPALLVNYFGQGALLLSNPQLAGKQVFFYLAPSWALFPLVVLATLATIIASQAIISASFSLTRQAVILGYLPRIRLVQTSEEKHGQIYIPIVNWCLMFAVIGLMLGFRQATNIAGAYGLAVSATMVITTLLMFIVAKEQWRWPLPIVIAITVGLLTVELPFFSANLFKFLQGGWFALAVAAVAFTLMTVWRTGQVHIKPAEGKGEISIDNFMQRIRENPPIRTEGTTVILTENLQEVPLLLLRHLEFFHSLHERVILLTPDTADKPSVDAEKRLEVQDLGFGIFRAIVHYGFMQNPNIPNVLKETDAFGEKIDLETVIYYVEYPKVIYGGRWGIKKFVATLFSFMARNTANPLSLFAIPLDRVFEVGVRMKL